MKKLRYMLILGSALLLSVNAFASTFQEILNSDNMKQEKIADVEFESREAILSALLSVSEEPTVESLLIKLLRMRASSDIDKDARVDNLIANNYLGFFNYLGAKAKLSQRAEGKLKVDLKFFFVPEIGNNEYLTFTLEIDQKGFQIIKEVYSKSRAMNT